MPFQFKEHTKCATYSASGNPDHSLQSTLAIHGCKFAGYMHIQIRTKLCYFDRALACDELCLRKKVRRIMLEKAQQGGHRQTPSWRTYTIAILSSIQYIMKCFLQIILRSFHLYLHFNPSRQDFCVTLLRFTPSYSFTSLPRINEGAVLVLKPATGGICRRGVLVNQS